MASTYTDQVNLRPGMTVETIDGEKLGKIIRLESSQLLVEKGFFFPQDFWIPASVVANADDDTAYLNISKDAAMNQQWGDGSTAAWDNRPAGTDYDISGAATTDTTGMDYSAGRPAGTREAYAVAGETGTAERMDTDKTVTVPVHEEELTATKRPVEAGDVVIGTRVVSEDRTLDVPITEERVRVTRRAVDRDATGNEAAFKEGTIDVPVQTEAVDVQKRVRVAEEVEVSKEPVQKTRTVTDKVRREVVDVKDNSNAEVVDGITGAGSAPNESEAP